MIIRGLDLQGDWLFGKGVSDFLTGQEAILGNAVTRLRSWKGDCFFAQAEGADYNSYLDVGTKDFLDVDVRRIILQSDGIMRIDSFESEIDRSSREYTARIEVTTFYGPLAIEV